MFLSTTGEKIYLLDIPALINTNKKYVKIRS